MVFMRLENPFLYPSRSMCATPMRIGEAFGAVIILPPPRVVILGLSEETVKMWRPMGPTAAKCRLRRWTTQLEDDHPPWESIKKAPIWEGAEWSSFRSILARPMLKPQLETRDEAVHTMHVEGQLSRDGQSTEGAQVKFLETVTRALRGIFTNRRFKTVCFGMGHSAVCVVHISIIYKTNDVWLILGAEPALSVLEKACCCPAFFCRVTIRP